MLLKVQSFGKALFYGQIQKERTSVKVRLQFELGIFVKDDWISWREAKEKRVAYVYQKWGAASKS